MIGLIVARSIQTEVAAQLFQLGGKVYQLYFVFLKLQHADAPYI
mgnify:CR=1 FL=1